MYTIPVKIEGIERRKKGTGLLHIAAGFLLLANAAMFLQLVKGNSFLLIAVYVAAAVSLVYGSFRKKLDAAAKFNHWVRLLQILVFLSLALHLMYVAGTMQVVMLLFWAVACIPLLFTERKVFHDAGVIINPSGISIPGYFSNKTFPWSVVDDLVLRKDYITLHFPGNKFLQYEIAGDLTNSIVDSVNSYCKKHIAQKQVLQDS
jgi:hypothetical protein